MLWKEIAYKIELVKLHQKSFIKSTPVLWWKIGN